MYSKEKEKFFIIKEKQKKLKGKPECRAQGKPSIKLLAGSKKQRRKIKLLKMPA